MDTINRECADALIRCVDFLHKDITKAKGIASKEGDDIESIGLSPEFVPVLGSAFRFLVGRNRDTCRKKLLLDMGCKVGLVIGESERYLNINLVPQVVEIKFEALLVLSGLIVELFLIEAKNNLEAFGADDLLTRRLQKFLESISEKLVISVQEMPIGEIAVVRFYATSREVRVCH